MRSGMTRGSRVEICACFYGSFLCAGVCVRVRDVSCFFFNLFSDFFFSLLVSRHGLEGMGAKKNMEHKNSFFSLLVAVLSETRRFVQVGVSGGDEDKVSSHYGVRLYFLVMMIPWWGGERGMRDVTV